MAQRIVAGIVLIGLGAGLFGSQLGGPTERLALGVALLALWGGIGLAVLAGVRPARMVGALLAIVGVILGSGVAVQANDGQATLAADLFFTVDGPTFSWIEVFFGAAAFVVLSMVVLVALLLDRRRTAPVATE
jgi:hypothetical protein